MMGYGQSMKNELCAHFNGPCLVIPPGMQIRSGDHADEPAFWIRMHIKQRTLLPISDLAKLLRFVDVRDLGSFTAKKIEDH